MFQGIRKLARSQRKKECREWRKSVGLREAENFELIHWSNSLGRAYQDDGPAGGKLYAFALCLGQLVVMQSGGRRVESTPVHRLYVVDVEDCALYLLSTACFPCWTASCSLPFYSNEPPESSCWIIAESKNSIIHMARSIATLQT